MEACIVVIDNDKSMRDLFTLSLVRQGWEVLSYPYTHINPTAVKKIHPDLIILDFNLQDDGIAWAFLQLLKMDHTTAKIPILITTTAFHLPTELQSYLWTRYISVVRKPFDMKTFLALIYRTLMLADQAEVILSEDPTLPILLVDNTENLRDTVATVLRLEGYRVVTANNGLTALDTVSNADYCLILLDITLPVMDGFEFLSAYKRQLRPHSPVIILSDEPDIRSKVFPNFVMDILQKPFEIISLLNLVKKFSQPV